MPISQNRGKSINTTKIVGLRKTGSVMNASINTSTNYVVKPSILSGVLGEAVDVTTTLFLAAFNEVGGFWYKATGLYSDNLFTKAVFLSGGAIGDPVNLQQIGIVSFINETFEIGKPVFVTTGSPNYSQDLLIESTTTNNLRQIIGFALSETDVLLDIQRIPFLLG